MMLDRERRFAQLRKAKGPGGGESPAFQQKMISGRFFYGVELTCLWLVYCLIACRFRGRWVF